MKQTAAKTRQSDELAWIATFYFAVCAAFLYGVFGI